MALLRAGCAPPCKLTFTRNVRVSGALCLQGEERPVFLFGDAVSSGEGAIGYVRAEGG